MKKIILSLSLILSGIYLANFIGAITVTKNSGEVLDNITWTNISSLTDKIDVSGSDIKLNGKLYVTGKICDGDGNCLGKSLIDKSSCENDAGWMWVPPEKDVYIGGVRGKGFCISPQLATDKGISWNGYGDYRNGWSSTSVDDSTNPYPQYGQTRTIDSPTPYSCTALGSATGGYIGEDTIVGRMKWLVGKTKTQLGSIAWISSNAKPGGHEAVPALYLSDCLDGVKDLGVGSEMVYKNESGVESTITYAQYNVDNTGTRDSTNPLFQVRQQYLVGWTQKKGSHIPSVFSYTNAGGGSCVSAGCGDSAQGEYEAAAELNAFPAGETIWGAAIGDGGNRFDDVARFINNNLAHSAQHPGDHHGRYFRIVVRP
ncbi:MAG: hypothetical protein N4A38_03170 [Candidatus Gracilibacteria bacterium]|nr:hypothetical protein [Candidatus Gracilibacteria bacterium]